jgi:AcrR family transcriptional regulator
MSTLGRPNIHFSDKRNELIQIALGLYLEKGYEATPISEILKAAGISKGTLYHYFTSKEEILDAVIEFIVESMSGGYQAILNSSDLSAMEKLRLVLSPPTAPKEEIISATDENYLKQVKSLFHYKMDEANYRVTQEFLRAVIFQGMEEGIFKTTDADGLSEFLAASRQTFNRSLQGGKTSVNEKTFLKLETLLQLMVMSLEAEESLFSEIKAGMRAKLEIMAKAYKL